MINQQNKASFNSTLRNDITGQPLDLGAMFGGFLLSPSPTPKWYKRFEAAVVNSNGAGQKYFLQVPYRLGNKIGADPSVTADAAQNADAVNDSSTARTSSNEVKLREIAMNRGSHVTFDAKYYMLNRDVIPYNEIAIGTEGLAADFEEYKRNFFKFNFTEINAGTEAGILNRSGTYRTKIAAAITAADEKGMYEICEEIAYDYQEIEDTYASGILSPLKEIVISHAMATLVRSHLRAGNLNTNILNANPYVVAVINGTNFIEEPFFTKDIPNLYFYAELRNNTIGFDQAPYSVDFEKVFGKKVQLQTAWGALSMIVVNPQWLMVCTIATI